MTNSVEVDQIKSALDEAGQSHVYEQTGCFEGSGENPVLAQVSISIFVSESITLLSLAQKTKRERFPATLPICYGVAKSNERKVGL